MTQLQYEELDLCRLIVKLDLGLASSWLFPSINFQFRTETFLSIFLGCQEWPARFWEVQAVGNVKILIQQRWESENKHPRKPLQNHRYADLWGKRPKKWLVEGISKKKNKNGKPVNFSFRKIWWASKVSLLAIRNDCVARSYRFSVPVTCTRAIIRQKVCCWLCGCWCCSFLCHCFSFFKNVCTISMDHIHRAWEWWYNGGRVPFFGKAVCILCSFFVLTYSKGSAFALLWYGFAKIGAWPPLYHHSHAWWIWPIWCCAVNG